MMNINRMSVLFFGVLTAALVLFSEARLSGAAEQEERTAVSAVNGLAVALYRELAADGTNLCFSPYSISSVMAMTYAGARGETALEMRRALGFKADIHGANRILREALQSAPKDAGELNIANSIWPARDYRISSAFGGVMRREYSTEVLPQDFRGQAERSRGAINGWVEKETRGKIKDILARGAIQADTRMILVNAIYFNAPWISKFDKSRTQDADFYVSPAETARVRMMNRTDRFEYAESDGAQILKLPYRRGVFSMLVILPKERDGLSAVEGSLSAGALGRYQMGLARRRVNVFLPKFRAEQTFDLVAPLAALGVESAFRPGRADFSGIGGRRDLHVDAVVHKAFVEVDEGGTEAAAATSVAVRLSSMPLEGESVTFRADHPFLYIIQDDRSGAILFMGKVGKP